eukprot:561887-Pyramimonas_sp.AAC.1
MRADVQEWTAIWFENHRQCSNDNSQWVECCQAFLSAMLARGGNDPLSSGAVELVSSPCSGVYPTGALRGGPSPD